VIPGGGHFFHGQLGLLKSLVLRHLGARSNPT
jgi:alpha/beta superfamily hydrolase